MSKVSPNVAVLLLVVALGAQFAFARYHLDAGSVVTTAVGVAVALLFGQTHAQTVDKLEATKTELVTLRASMRPGREPSMHDLDTIPPTEAPKP